MKYRNVKTGAVIETECEVKGGNWEPVEVPTAPVKTTPKKKQVKK